MPLKSVYLWIYEIYKINTGIQHKSPWYYHEGFDFVLNSQFSLKCGTHDYFSETWQKAGRLICGKTSKGGLKCRSMTLSLHTPPPPPIPHSPPPPPPSGAIELTKWLTYPTIHSGRGARKPLVTVVSVRECSVTKGLLVFTCYSTDI